MPEHSKGIICERGRSRAHHSGRAGLSGWAGGWVRDDKVVHSETVEGKLDWSVNLARTLGLGG